MLHDGPAMIQAGPAVSPNVLAADLHQLLGSSGYHQYQAYRDILSARQTAAEFAGALSTATSAPLSPQQVRQITDIFAQRSAPDHPHQLDWPSAVTQAQGILSPTQWEMLPATFRSRLAASGRWKT